MASRPEKPGLTRVMFRLPTDILAELQDEAKEQQRSVTNLVRWLVVDYAKRVRHRKRTGELPPPPG